MTVLLWLWNCFLIAYQYHVDNAVIKSRTIDNRMDCTRTPSFIKLNAIYAFGLGLRLAVSNEIACDMIYSLRNRGKDIYLV